jgi:hypothetical protein
MLKVKNEREREREEEMTNMEEMGAGNGDRKNERI